MNLKPFPLLGMVGLFIFLVAFSSAPKKFASLDARSIDRNLIQVDEGLFALPFEVSNGEYRSFLQDLPSEKAISFRPDSTGWSRHMAFSDPIQDTYFSHPAFEAYPVVNISYEAAQAYCQWLTSQYHADEKRTYKQVIIRLPSEEEWEQAALKAVDTSKWGAIFPWNGYRLVDDKGRPLANFKYVHQAAIKQSPFQEDLVLDPKIKKKFTNYSEDGYMVTSPVNGFPVNPAGFYNLGGNACEMLSERGKAKGGSWASTGYYLRVHSVENYEQPTPFLGFRCFVEVVEE